ncbi:Ribosomal_L6e_N domain-containing protein [Meloidogyne graminicola]|uniref:Large ribosomal subunit protein eL6 n=1 Tax=Meloidogyne graminicola TaxID=189291 RepID=A0A8S9ZSP2_9BILA|nr:Ribosomal_L6e_N domain-containing protein [Meloidogyne graminicola]
MSSKAKRSVKKVPLRKSITPGTILIILVGRHRGKRVVFLKQLEKSGLLLVTGPLKLNACPLRRIAQSFVIATKTKLDLTGLQVPGHIDDDYLKRKLSKSNVPFSFKFLLKYFQKYEVTEQRKLDQKTVDAGVLDAIRSHPDKKYLFGYLGSRFHLAKGMYPHKMNF